MAVDALRQVFKTLADPTRMRLLAVLEREELAVGELMQILDMAQSTVSRHLAILKDAGLVRDRREGTFVYYRTAPPGDGDWREVWDLTKRSLRDDPTAAHDSAALETIIEGRALRTRAWFDSVAPEWDSLRRVFNDDIHRARAISRLVPPRLCVADIGTGTGVLARELATAGLSVIAVDHSERMLEAARQNLRDVTARVELRRGDAGDLPLADGEVDAAFAHMVLHYLASPADAIREMARVVAAGGRVVIVDFVQHDRDWMKERLGVVWQGFPLDTIRTWFHQAGLVALEIDVDEPSPRNHDLPATFIASATKTESASQR